MRTVTIEWVPVAEGLPDGHGPYLYTNSRGMVGMGTPALIDGQVRLGNVVAWAELPEPYREDE